MGAKREGEGPGKRKREEAGKRDRDRRRTRTKEDAQSESSVYTQIQQGLKSLESLLVVCASSLAAYVIDVRLFDILAM